MDPAPDPVVQEFLDLDRLEEFLEDVLNKVLDQRKDDNTPVTLPCFDPEETHTGVPQNVLDNYTLVLDERFDGALDPNTWNTELVWGSNLTINTEEQYYVDVLGGDTQGPNPISFNADGDLVITAAPITGPKPVTDGGIAGGQNYTSAIIHTRDSHCFTHGYVEVCAKVPKADGAWPATWLLNCFYYDNASVKAAQEGIANPNDKFNPEIDFMEMVDGPNYFGSNNTKFAYHYFTGDRQTTNTNHSRWSLGTNFKEVNVGTGNQLSNFNVYQDCAGNNQYSLPDYAPGVDFSQDFHIYAVDWNPDYIHYYVDGILIHCVNTKSIISDQAMYLLINFAVGGVFPFGFPGSSTYRMADPADYPAELVVKSARIYTV